MLGVRVWMPAWGAGTEEGAEISQGEWVGNAQRSFCQGEDARVQRGHGGGCD